MMCRPAPLVLCLEAPNNPHNEASILPDGRIVVLSVHRAFAQSSIYTPSNTPVSFSLNPPSSMNGSIYYNNLLYIGAVNTIILTRHHQTVFVRLARRFCNRCLFL
ncbi:MAG: hypothetical protein R2788_17935 [Saprospiraceae bacterium]